MKKDVATRTNRADRMPVTRRPSFASPWFDDFEPAKWFDDFFSRDLSPFYGDNRFLAPAIDIDETNEEYLVSADLPGVKKEDISIECAGNQLSISAERKYESVDGKKSDRRERYYGSYQRSFTLPAGADMDKVEASYDGGVLNIRIPKGEQAKGRRIEIGEAKSQTQETSNKH
jgi:HSP20 family protein